MNYELPVEEFTVGFNFGYPFIYNFIMYIYKLYIYIIFNFIPSEFHFIFINKLYHTNLRPFWIINLETLNYLNIDY